MADDQKTDLPPYDIASPQQRAEPNASSKRSSTRRWIIIAVSVVLVAAFILVAILVGVYFFQQTQKEILKFTLELNKDTKQDTISDPNSNVVQYHVQKTDYDLLVIEDFNKDIRTLKVKEKTQTICLMTPLNRSAALTPEAIDELSKKEDSKKEANTTEYNVRYTVSETPVSDISFLGTKASVACKGISTYWLFPYCDNDKNLRASPGRKRRAWCWRKDTWCCQWGFLRLWCISHCSNSYWRWC